ncbi:hypothetical protein Cde04nite_01660 [Cellulomonas denverensis]|nr:hypothetical protein Cde04nite_01660 [Cellulomonas denverensis]
MQLSRVARGPASVALSGGAPTASVAGPKTQTPAIAIARTAAGAGFTPTAFLSSVVGAAGCGPPRARRGPHRLPLTGPGPGTPPRPEWIADVRVDNLAILGG